MNKQITELEDYIVHTHHTAWHPLVEPNVDTAGITVKVLRRDEKSGRAPSFLLKFDPGASYPYHNHPAGEELLILEGSAIIENTHLTAGDYLFTPPSFKHSVKSETGCIILFVVPEEVQIL